MKRATKVQSLYLSIMKERPPSAPADYPGHPALIDRGPAVNNFVARSHGSGEGSWLWMAPSTAKVMKKNGWIEWHPGSATRRAGFYITDAGREVLFS